VVGGGWLKIIVEMKKVLFVDSVHPLIKRELSDMGFLCEEFPEYIREDFKRIIPEYTGIVIRSKIKLDREMLSGAEQLRFIGRVGSGLENIDVEFAQSMGIHCLNSPEGNRDAVGEHCVGLLLNLLNHISRADRQVRQGHWIREGNRGREIGGRTVGIIGYGNMGGSFARKLSGFGAEVIAWDKYRLDYGDRYARACSMEEIWERAGIVSLHVPLTEETRYLADFEFFDRFRNPIVFLNTSRGQVVKTSALAAALRSGRVEAAGLDVLEYEESSLEALVKEIPEELKYLFTLDQVLFTPHIAGWTVESNTGLARVLVDKIRNTLDL
jgi:D-3-phosphoglycerate dehydrogenase